MPHWNSETEEIVITRLANGERWPLNDEDRKAIWLSWDTESRKEQAEAIRAQKTLKKALNAKRGKNPTLKPSCEAFAVVCQTYSPRWDVFKGCMDNAKRPPTCYDEAQRHANAVINHALAVLSRRNPNLQTIAMALREQYHACGDYEAHTPTHIPMDRDYQSALQEAITALTALTALSLKEGHDNNASQDYTHTLITVAQALDSLWTEQWPHVKDTVAKTKARLSLELRRVGGVRCPDYWLPLSAVDVKVWIAATRYRCVPRFPG